MATIKSKVIANVIIVLLTVIAIVGFNYADLKKLQRLQDEGAGRAADALAANEASDLGARLYRVIADAEINRDLKETAKAWSEEKEKETKVIEHAVQMADTAEEKEWTAAAKKATEQLIDLFENRMLPQLKASKDMTDAIRTLDGEMDKQIVLIQDNMDKISASMGKESKEADAQFDSTVKSAIVKALVIGLVGILVQAGLAGWLLRTILRPIDAMVVMLRDMAEGEGDLTQRLDDSSKDEIAVAGRLFNEFIAKIRNAITQVADGTVQVASASSQLHVTAEHIAAGAEEVASQATTLATAGEEMAVTGSDIARNCLHAAERAKHASDTAIAGGVVVQETIEGMQQIAAQVQEAARTVESLGERSDQIGSIIGTIEDIADQTNLLALNAAIEAARAGDQGRGFAVVADEVRALAERTTTATREISEMIKSIQQETRGAVTTMEEGVRQVEHGTVASRKSGEALEDILAQVNDVTMQINQIATAVEEQTATTNDISSNIQQITDVVSESAKSASETADASGQLARLAESMQQVVRQFKLG